MNQLITYFENSRKEILDRLFLLPEGSVLEVGCGHGNVIKAISIKWKNFKHTGIDLSLPEGMDVNGNLSLIGDDLFNHHKYLSNISYDYILALDVIEHIDEVGDFLSYVSRLMHKNSRLVLSIPNIRFLPALLTILICKDFPEESSGIFDKTHRRFYTKKKIRRTLESNEFVVNKIVGINSLLEVQPSVGRKVLVGLITPIILLLDTEMNYQQFYVVCRKNYD